MENLHDGRKGTDRVGTKVVQSIDEAIRNCRRKIESKKPESAISPVEVPKEYICTLSKAIMIEPMTIASSQVSSFFFFLLFFIELIYRGFTIQKWRKSKPN